jgi:hypothetical protein
MNVNELISQEATKAVEDAQKLIKANDIKSIVFKTDQDEINAQKLVVEIRKKRIEIEKTQKEEIAEDYTNYVNKRDYFKPFIQKLNAILTAFDNAKKVRDAEKKRIQDKISKELEEEKKKKEDEAKKAKEKANEYKENGRTDLAEKWEAKAEEKQLESDMFVPPSNTVSRIPVVRGGFNTRVTYKAEITDMKEVYYHFHRNGLPPAVKQAIQQYFDQQARASRGTQSPYKGVKYIKV